MTKTCQRVSAALLSVLLLCMFTFGASAAASLNVGVKFWKEKTDKESMANSGIDTDRDASLPASPTAPIPSPCPSGR